MGYLILLYNVCIYHFFGGETLAVDTIVVLEIYYRFSSRSHIRPNRVC